MNPHNVIVTAEGFTLRAELNALAAEKSEKILRHENPSVHRVRLHVRHETPHGAAACFVARATAEHAGPDHIAHASAAEPAAAIHAALAILERALCDAAGLRKQARHSHGALA